MGHVKGRDPNFHTIAYVEDTRPHHAIIRQPAACELSHPPCRWAPPSGNRVRLTYRDKVNLTPIFCVFGRPKKKPPFQGGFLVATGAGNRNRTYDLIITNDILD